MQPEGKTPPRPALPQGLPANPGMSFDPAKSVVLGSEPIPPPAPLSDTRQVLPPWTMNQNTTPLPDVGDGVATFKLEHQIGRGGFGEVWQAIQVSLGRVVAVKRLRPDLLEKVKDEPSRQFALEIAFQQEAVTTASLEHPNIVPIHDLGRDASGRPVLAMKRLRGRTWEDVLIADFNVLPVADFLAKHLPTLVDAAQAVAFAHSRGVVHRDLKPSQVMVGEFGEVLLLDWGLAVAYDPKVLAEQTQSSATNIAPTRETATNPAGTIVFMAPEQTDPTAARIGPWTDVYLLGGTLYFVLTGTPPHHTDDVAQAFFRAAEGIVEPPEKRAPHREIPPELSAIAMKAMSIETYDRHQSVQKFIEEVSDYLTGASKRREALVLIEGVERRLARMARNYRALSDCATDLARAQGLWPGNPRAAELVEKTIEEHARTAVENGDLILAREQTERLAEGPIRTALLVEIGGLRSAVASDRRQRKVAIVAACVMAAGLIGGGAKYYIEEKAAAARQAEDNERLRAQRERSEAVLGYMLGDLSDKLDSTGRIAILGDVAQRALAYYDSQPKEAESLASMRSRASAYRQIAFVLRRRPDLKQARETIDKALAIMEPQLAEMPDDPEVLYFGAGAYLESANLAENALEAERMLHDIDAAIAAVRKLTKLQPDNLEAASLLARCLLKRGEYASRSEGVQESLDMYRASLAAVQPWMGKADPPVAARTATINAESYIGSALSELGQLDEAAKYMISSIEAQRALLASDPGNYTYRFDAVQLSGDLTSILLRLGRKDDALKYADAMLVDAKDLARRDPDNVSYSHWLGGAHYTRGVALTQFNRSEDAIADFEAALAQYERNLVIDPKFGPSRDNISPALSQLAIAYLKVGRRDEAVETLRKSVSRAEEIYNNDTTDSGNISDYAAAMGQLGDILAAGGAADEAIPYQEKARDLMRALAKRDSDGTQALRNLAILCARIGQTYQFAGRPRDAIGAVTEAESIMRTLRDKTPESVDLRREHAAALVRSGMVHRGVGSETPIVGMLTEAKDELEAITRENPGNVSWFRELAIANNALAMELVSQKDAAGAIPYFERAVEVCRTVLDQTPGNLGFEVEIVASLNGLAEAKLQVGRTEDALKDLESGLEKLTAVDARVSKDVNRLLRRAYLLDMRGRCFETLLDMDRARSDWEAALAILQPEMDRNSNDPRFLEEYAVLLLRLDRPAQADEPIRKLAGLQNLRKQLLELMKKKGALVPMKEPEG